MKGILKIFFLLTIFLNQYSVTAQDTVLCKEIIKQLSLLKLNPSSMDSIDKHWFVRDNILPPLLSSKHYFEMRYFQSQWGHTAPEIDSFGRSAIVTGDSSGFSAKKYSYAIYPKGRGETRKDKEYNLYVISLFPFWRKEEVQMSGGDAEFVNGLKGYMEKVIASVSQGKVLCMSPLTLIEMKIGANFYIFRTTKKSSGQEPCWSAAFIRGSLKAIYN